MHILQMTQNIHGYPRHVTMTTDIGQPADLTGESRITVNPALTREISEEDDDDSRDSEERSADNDVLKRRDRRNTPGRSFKGQCEEKGNYFTIATKIVYELTNGKRYLLP